MTVLDALRDAVAGHVGPDGPVPGAVVGVTGPEDDHHLASVGVTAPGGTTPLPPDALLRISSNTKPMVAALTMMLVADGALALDDPVERFLPELAGRRVLLDLEGPLDDTVPAERPATVDDLLTLRQGFGVVFAPCPAQDAARAAGLGLGPPQPAPDDTLDDWVARFAAIPLMVQPGTRWMYDLDYTVLGAVLTRAGGRDLGTLLRERLCGPLGMAETAFAAPPGRLVPSWHRTEEGLAPADPAEGGGWEQEPGFPDGRGGLVSTAADLLRFAAFVLREGTAPDGTVLLAREAVTAMTTDQLTPEQRDGPSAQIFLGGAGWGRGVEVVGPEHGLQRDGHVPRTARHRWAGGLGTLWVSYPERGVAAVLGTQVMPPSAPVFDAFGEALRVAVDG